MECSCRVTLWGVLWGDNVDNTGVRGETVECPSLCEVILQGVLWGDTGLSFRLALWGVLQRQRSPSVIPSGGHLVADMLQNQACAHQWVTWGLATRCLSFPRCKGVVCLERALGSRVP